MADLIATVATALPEDLPPRIGVAVSGGSDSMALLALLHPLSLSRGFELCCVTVDHRLRAEAAAEAGQVAAFCAALGISHDTLTWREWDGSGNTQNAARRARYGLMADWAKERNISAIALGHTLDDQAETVLMRLARGAGVDGLTAMVPARQQQGVLWLRPLLSLRRDALRAHLRAQGISWHDDPTNDALCYDRIKVRKALELLAPLGLTAEALGQVAQNMQAARQALDIQTHTAARQIASQQAGAVKLDSAGFDALPEEVARRLVVAALKWIAGAVYAPRGRALAQSLETLRRDGSATLHGCVLMRRADSFWIFREYNAVRSQRTSVEAVWDARWILQGQGGDASLSIAALGEEGLAHCPDWRATGLPRALLLATPALWRGELFLAAPLAGWRNGWQAHLEKERSCFFDSVFSH